MTPNIVPIFYYTNELTKVKAAPIAGEDFNSDNLKLLIAQLHDTMRNANGVGMAAPQIGVWRRVAVVKNDDDLNVTGEGVAGGNPLLVIINPEIIDGWGDSVEWEGCLSIPGKGCRARVRRNYKIKFRFQDISGEVHEDTVQGLRARIIQHEIDHLDGVFYVNRVSRLQRQLVMGHFQKHLKSMRPAGSQ